VDTQKYTKKTQEDTAVMTTTIISPNYLK